MSLLRGEDGLDVSSPYNIGIVFAVAALYVLSGSTQPLLITLVKQAGLGDSACQVYMLFYYLGPALVSFKFCIRSSSPPPPSPSPSPVDSNPWPRRHVLFKSAGIASLDIVAQAMNYTGSTFCGPTIFSIIYSSVTIWTALYSRMVLARAINKTQWIAVFTVFAGLAITAWDSAAMGTQVLRGTVLVFMGSSLHAMTYVLSEAIMTRRTSYHHNSDTEQLDVATNCAVQGLVALFVYLTWQFVYTLPRLQDRIVIPAQQSGTTLTGALLILFSLAASNLVHALTFFHTLKCFPGGATSAGVMKGLQAVLVFVFSSLVYCGREAGGEEMCFTTIKLVSLVVVVAGVILFAVGSDSKRNQSRNYYTSIEVDDNAIEDDASLHKIYV